MATFTLVLDKRRAKQNGTFPLVFRIGIGRKNTFIRTGIYILENQFDSSRNIIKDSAELNEQLILLDSAYIKRFYQYILSHKCMNC